MLHKFIIIISLLISFMVFIGWMSIVGNPHVVETILGLIISIGLGISFYIKFRPKTK